MAILDNANPSKNPITTYIGTILLLWSLIIFTLPYFTDLKKPVETYIVIIVGLVGLGLIIIPDNIKAALTKLFNKKVEEV